MVELRAVRHRYAGRVVLDFDQFALPQAAAVAVVGHNGSGKSTLLRLLALLERPTEGSVLWNGTVVPRRPAASLRRRVTLVEQRPVLLRGTVRDNLVYGLEIRGFGRSAVNGIIGDVVDRLGLGPLLGRRRHELPAGDGVKTVRIGSIEIVVMTERTGPAVVAIPPTDIFVSRERLASSARNVFKGRVVGLAIERHGAGVHVRAEMGGVELVAAVTAEAARDLALAPGGSVVFSFKATAVRVF